MLSMRECEVQELVRQERLRESEEQRLLRLVSRQRRSRLQELVEELRERSRLLRQRVSKESLVS